jgi:ribose 5-phosphate isomerase A
MLASWPWLTHATAESQGVTDLNLKIEAARAALQEVRSGMTLGLGTGSTAFEFVRLLGEALRSGALGDIRCTTTSEKTEKQAREEGIPTFPLAEVAPLQLAVDGADEIDEQLRLIKGRGGALLREKIVEQQAARFIVIADESKIVERLGVGPLPVEVTPFALDVLTRRFTGLGLQPTLRMLDGKVRVTDEGNRILDVLIPRNEDIDSVVARIRMLAGVVETGYFPTEATEAVIAGSGGIRRVTR